MELDRERQGSRAEFQVQDFQEDLGTLTGSGWTFSAYLTYAGVFLAGVQC